jgi:CRP-like cAMP-binding protein
VIGAGLGYRITRKALLHAFNHSRQVRSLLLRYTLALMAHMAQNVVCTRHHQLEQQFCSLLLLCCDRFPPEIILTHEQLSDMLGVRREGVTLAASHLQEAGLIRYTRGHIKILDRNGLEGRACECYALVKTECDLLLHP